MISSLIFFFAFLSRISLVSFVSLGILSIYTFVTVQITHFFIKSVIERIKLGSYMCSCSDSVQGRSYKSHSIHIIWNTYVAKIRTCQIDAKKHVFWKLSKWIWKGQDGFLRFKPKNE